jgi:hypothetical protein
VPDQTSLVWVVDLVSDSLRRLKQEGVLAALEVSPTADLPAVGLLQGKDEIVVDEAGSAFQTRDAGIVRCFNNDVEFIDLIVLERLIQINLTNL